MDVFLCIGSDMCSAACDVVARHEKRIMGIFLYIGLNMCIGRSTQSSHGDGFFEYPQLVIILAIEEKFALKLNVF